VSQQKRENKNKREEKKKKEEAYIMPANLSLVL